MPPPEVQRVTLEEAEAEVAARAVRLVTVVRPLWLSSRQWTAAVVLAVFPLLFLVDGWFAFPFSPVLPGLVVLLLLIIGLPFVLVELHGRRFRRKDAEWQSRSADRSVVTSRAALAAAAVWVLLWFAVGT